MFHVYDDETRKRVLDEVLKGERGVNDIAAAEGITEFSIRKWLDEHYAANPDDPRRHLVVRSSERYQRKPEQQTLELDAEGAAEEGERAAEDAGADQTREDMSAKKKQPGAKGNAHPKREQILAEYDAAEGARGTMAELNRKYGVSVQSISGGLRTREVNKARHAKENAAREAVIADIKAGYSGETLVSRHKKKLGKTTIYRIQSQYRAQDEARKEQLRENAAKGRAALAEKVAESRRGRAEEAQIDSTLISQTPPRRSLDIVPASSPMPTDARILGDSLGECIEERTVLRGMVALLNRENDQLKRDLREYQRTYGEIRR